MLQTSERREDHCFLALTAFAQIVAEESNLLIHCRQVCDLRVSFGGVAGEDAQAGQAIVQQTAVFGDAIGDESVDNKFPVHGGHCEYSSVTTAAVIRGSSSVS